MRHGAAGRRSRNRGKGNRQGNGNHGRTHVFDSNGPEVRIRGTAHQIFDKYDALAKDATSTGDYILAQSYLQHAEHYQRVINNWEEIIRNGGYDPALESHDSNTRSEQPVEEDLGLPETITGSRKPAADKELENV